MTKIAITGSSGFLATHTINCLRLNNHNIIPITRKSLPGMITVKNYLDCPKADILIHFAEESNQRLVNQKGEKYIISSAKTVENLVNKFGKSLIYASSGVVYGDNEKVILIDKIGAVWIWRLHKETIYSQ